jgi:hypothetical protein
MYNLHKNLPSQSDVWHMPVIPAAQKVGQENWGSRLAHAKCEALSENQTEAKGTQGMVQVVEHLPSK